MVRAHSAQEFFMTCVGLICFVKMVCHNLKAMDVLVFGKSRVKFEDPGATVRCSILRLVLLGIQTSLWTQA